MGSGPYTGQIAIADDPPVEFEQTFDQVIGGGGSQPITTHAGTPVGVVTPSQIGALVIDTTNGALYIATGATSADWFSLGGVAAVVQSGTAPGIGSNSGGPTSGAAISYISVEITDPAAAAGSGNAWYWNPNLAADGLQESQLILGSTGQFTHTWKADGSYVAPEGVGQFGHAAPASQPATPVLLSDVIALLQSYGMCS